MDCDIDWNPVASAGLLSAMTGVLAGLVFAGIVVLLSDRARNHEHKRAVMLLTAALFALVMDSLLLSVIGGERSCYRTWVGFVLAVSLGCVGLLTILGGICSLISAYDDHDRRATRLAVFGTFVFAILLVYFVQSLGRTMGGYLRLSGLIPPNPAPLRFVIAHWTEGVALVVVLLLILRRSSRRRQTARLVGSERAAVATAYLSIAFVAITAALIGYILDLPLDAWVAQTWAVPAALIRAVQLMSLVIVTMTLVAQLLALPRSHRHSPADALGEVNVPAGELVR